MSTRRRLAPTGQPWWQRIHWQAIVGALLIVVAAYTAGTVYQTGVAAQRAADCQAGLNAQFLQVLKTYDAAQRATSDAQRRLLTANTRGDAAAGTRARDEYLQALNVLDRTRLLAPLPVVTRC